MRIAGLIVLLMFSFNAKADLTYIKEVEGLLNSLSSKDSSRPALALKLADAYFDEATKESRNNMGVVTDKCKIYRQKAIALYNDSLTGFDGRYPKPFGSLKHKIQFQLARIYNDEGNKAKAIEFWNVLSAEESPTEIKRESILRLAENAEQKKDAASMELAKKLYIQSLSLCSSQDVCSYSHYRLAWVYKFQGQAPQAIEEMQKALFDSKNQVREEALRDLLVFVSGQPTDGHEALALIETLNAKINRPTLELDLSRGFFSAGNRPAGTYVLEFYNKKFPSFKGHASLLEEYYGFRDWQKFRQGLEDVAAFSKGKEIDADSKIETEKILRRLTVQLDGERTTSPEHVADFKNAVMYYMSLFGNGPERTKMIDGWLVAETSAEAKIIQLQKWIAEENAAGRKSEELRLRDIRASEAQKISKYEVVADEMAVIKNLNTEIDKKREATYQQAYALLKLKRDNEALALFKELAVVKTKPDTWAVQSQHLALDILGQQKAYKNLLAQAQSWTLDPQFENWVKQSEKSDELKEMKKIAQNAAFEGAVAEGATPEALKLFTEYCEKGIEASKSCENAKVVAFKLKNESVYISMLRKLGQKNELIAELEVSGRFNEAASHLAVSLTPKRGFDEYLKVALLYELGGNLKSRDEVLKNMIQKAINQKGFGDQEELIFATMKETGLLTQASLKWPWKKDTHTRLVSYLEDSGMGNAETRKILMASCENMGVTWEKVVFEEMKRLDAEQSRIVFTGKNSKKKFEVRLAALKKLGDVSTCYLQGATAGTRVVMAHMLAKSQYKMANDIKASPIPEGLDAEVVAQLQASMEQMAAPFVEKAKTFDALALEQLEKVTNLSEKTVLQEKLKADSGPLDLLHLTPKVAEVNKPDGSVLQSAIALLNSNPNEITALEKLKGYYEAINKPRLAAYFQGRLKQMEGNK